MNSDKSKSVDQVQFDTSSYINLYQHGTSAITRLFNTPSHLVHQFDLAEMNLICAFGLPGTDGMDIPAMLRQIDLWTKRVAIFTKQNMHAFTSGQSDYDSLAKFKIASMVHIIINEFGVKYNPARINNPDNFEDAEDTFIHGILGPRRMGTCSSLPVLFTSIGRRLGYPLKLVEAPGHLFYRWDTPTEKFNVEFHAQGMNIQSDEYYMTWPRRWDDAIIKQEQRRPSFLISLTPPKELALCAASRAYVLDANNIRKTEAAQTLRIAYQLDRKYHYGIWLNHLNTKALNPDQTFPELPCEQTAGIDVLKAAAAQGVLDGGRIKTPDGKYL